LEQRAASLVLGGLILDNSIKVGDPFATIDVEKFFSALVLLDERNGSEISPFVDSWHSAVHALERESAASQPRMLRHHLDNALGLGPNVGLRDPEESRRQSVRSFSSAIDNAFLQSQVHPEVHLFRDTSCQSFSS